MLVADGLLLVVALGIDIAYDLDDARRGLPSWRRQVDEAWLGLYHGWVTGVGFGYQLGLGVVTISTSATTYAVLLLAVLAGGPGTGAPDRGDLRAGAGAAVTAAQGNRAPGPAEKRLPDPCAVVVTR